MFLAFDASQGEGLSNPKHPRRSERIGRRGMMMRACNSCRRRKIKCSGDKPCESCRWYKTPEMCVYPERRQSSSHSERSETASNPYRVALERLFPDQFPENIVNLPREALVELMNGGGSQSGQHQDSPTLAASIHTNHSALSLGQPVLESLHSMPPEEGLDQDQCPSRSGSLEQISDDVNALSLTTRQPASYLGVSSTQAALKVITWLLPRAKPYTSHARPRDHDRAVNPTPSSSSQSGLAPTEGEILDAYFVDFHTLAPLLDEKSFRATHLIGNRTDSRWLALLNIVLALGSIAASDPDNHNHRTYFDRSMNLLNFAILGAPSIETVQTLGLIGGWYCHYVSQPNLGYSLIGVALRMAVSLGLQREPYDSHFVPDPTRAAYREYKRRVWWALCCLETWGHETLGRASMDLFAPTITVSQPRLLDEESYLAVLPLIENVRFIKIASKIQEALASMPMITLPETFELDAQLLRWWDDLPPAVRDYEPCPESLYTARTVMRWRFYNQRMLLYRPKLLNYAMRRAPFMTIRMEERNAILKCREIAETTIQDISMTTRLNQMIGWNGVWFLFQATMVPLIYLATRPRNDDSAASFASCKMQAETAMLTLDRMRPYGPAAQRSLEVISGILEACLEGAAVETPDTMTEGLGFQGISQMNAFDSYSPTTRDQLSDWTGMSLESLPPQSMWEFLSWGAEDLWPGVPVPGFTNQGISTFQTHGGGG
ncbi:uncharacterized protein N7459_005086 [Penicillium hispanicum]|uniref:uncharacterized protein n=1 Tax=Penicillium hispanicum TaxID=1080232 RepID=UPI00253FFEA7|nr:uncharacterized protein N7459_005086 [Penicillium hispanicum]KAJ5585286.1 hypothetical protein N7459_005086 [Penicillium hispanicum]